MPRADDSLDRLRAAIDELAASDAADLLAEARIEARARVRTTLTDALAHSMLERLHEQLDAPARVRPAPALPARSSPSPPPAEPSGERAWYVYGVVAADTELNEAMRGVDPAEPVTLLSQGALAAVASRVPLEKFGEASLREHLADMAWVEATARAHEAVLDAVRERATVVPMRMCTVYRTEGGIREMLTRESEPLRDAIDHLDGKAEWGVKVFTHLAGGHGGTQDVDADGDEGTGVAYMERLRTERELRERAMEVAEEAAAHIDARLRAVAPQAQAIPLQRPEVSGHSGAMILNGVYLVADDAAAALYDEVEALRSEFEAHGIELVLTGPWPAYNFVPGTIGAAW